MKNLLEFDKKSRTNLVALASVALGVLKLIIPALAISVAPSILILNGLGMLYLREALSNSDKENKNIAEEVKKETDSSIASVNEEIDAINKRRRGM